MKIPNLSCERSGILFLRVLPNGLGHLVALLLHLDTDLLGQGLDLLHSFADAWAGGLHFLVVELVEIGFDVGNDLLELFKFFHCYNWIFSLFI